MTLFIDATNREVITVSLKHNGKIVKSLVGHNKYGSQVLLPLIKEILEKEEITFEDVTDIELPTGPGSFTGLRVGAAVANALAFSLGIPVNGKKIETDLKY